MANPSHFLDQLSVGWPRSLGCDSTKSSTGWRDHVSQLITGEKFLVRDAGLPQEDIEVLVDLTPHETLFFSNRWARLMQIELQKGHSIVTVALTTAFQAAEGIQALEIHMPPEDDNDAFFRSPFIEEAIDLLAVIWRLGDPLCAWYQGEIDKRRPELQEQIVPTGTHGGPFQIWRYREGHPCR